MSKPTDHIDLFTRYESGDLTPEELRAFEERLETDGEFRDAYEEFRFGIHLIKSAGIGKEAQALIKKKKQKSTQRLWVYAGTSVAAAVTLLLLLVRPAASPEQLFDQYFEPFPNSVTSRDTQGILNEALTDYSLGNYRESVDKFNLMAIESDTVYFYRALAHLALKEPRESMENFKEIEPNGVFSDPAVWYKGLAFLLDDRLDSATYYFERLTIDDPNKANGEAILNAIK